MIVDFGTLVALQMTAMQASLPSVMLNFGVGTIFRAVIESNAALALGLQQEILNLVKTSRASTSTGNDLDTWMSDFGMVRLGALPAYGTVTFSRFTTLTTASIPVGSTVASSDGSCSFVVTQDATNPYFNLASLSYVIPLGVASINLSIIALTYGSVGNASANNITNITKSIPGIDTVTNAAAFINGVDVETDADFRTRFVATLASLNKATMVSVTSAIAAAYPTINFNVVENKTTVGADSPGYFYVVIDDGTGYPSGELITAVSSTVTLVRPLCSKFDVVAPTVTTVNISMTVTLVVESQRAVTVANIKTMLQKYVNTLTIGSDIFWTRLYQLIYDADPNVLVVSALTLNGATSDIVVDNVHVIKVGTMAVN